MKPDWYEKLPQGQKCKCIGMIKEGKDYYCCKGIPSDYIPDPETLNMRFQSDRVIQ